MLEYQELVRESSSVVWRESQANWTQAAPSLPISALAWSGGNCRWSPTSGLLEESRRPTFKSGGSSPAHQVPREPSRPRPVVIERNAKVELVLWMMC